MRHHAFPGKERKYLDMLTANKVDGIIVSSHSVDIDYPHWFADHIPGSFPGR